LVITLYVTQKIDRMIMNSSMGGI